MSLNKKSGFQLYNTTTLAKNGHKKLLPIIRYDRPNPTRAISFSNCSFEDCGTGIMLRKKHRCPQLSTTEISEITQDEPEYITRHIEGGFLDAARGGYFRLGTLVNYRAKENDLAGRLGDHEESRQQETFKSRTDFIESSKLHEIEVSNSSFERTDRHIVIETVVNDYCSCSSIGKFNEKRGQELKDKEVDPSKKPGAFVTYHVPKLKKALEAYFSKKPDLSAFTLIGRKVEYDQKDRLWEIEDRFELTRDADTVATWLGIAFIKSPKFVHEEEYRLLLVNPNSPGNLEEAAEAIVIEEDDGIASAIHISDYY